MSRSTRIATCLFVILLASSCSDEKTNPFALAPDCAGPAISQGHGDRALVINSLQIADQSIGLDLNGDGTIDNAMAVLGGVVNQELGPSLKTGHDVILPFELFGYTGADSACTKMQLYTALFNTDDDNDDYTTTWSGGDCMDGLASVHPKATEDLMNRLDDDCDGYADNMTKGSAPDDDQDLDGDGYTLRMGDCDDRGDAASIDVAKSRHPGATEICRNGIDEDCDGIPDNGSACDPYAANAAPLVIDSTVAPIPFGAGKVEQGVYTAGPGTFSIALPGVTGHNAKFDKLPLSLTAVRVSFPLTDGAGGTTIQNGILGGVFGTQALAAVTGIDAGGVIDKSQSLLDAVFTGALGGLLGLDHDMSQHVLPDMDLDGDGLETFYQEMTSPDGVSHVDTCKDGNGDIVHNNFDGQGTPCYLAKNPDGTFRFVDGLSIALVLNAVPSHLAQ